MSLRQRGRTHFHGNGPRRAVCSVVFSFLFFSSHRFKHGARKMSQLATWQMRRLRLMAVTSGAKWAEEAGEVHFDHVHLIYESPRAPNPVHEPAHPCAVGRLRTGGVAINQRARGASKAPSSFPLIWMETDVVAGKSRKDKHGRGEAAVGGWRMSHSTASSCRASRCLPDEINKAISSLCHDI